jgi:hypothetical protein
MPRSKLRIVERKEIPVLGVCERCDAQFPATPANSMISRKPKSISRNNSMVTPARLWRAARMRCGSCANLPKASSIQYALNLNRKPSRPFFALLSHLPQFSLLAFHFQAAFPLIVDGCSRIEDQPCFSSLTLILCDSISKLEVTTRWTL